MAKDLFSRQLAKATSAAGDVALDELARSVNASYEAADRARQRLVRAAARAEQDFGRANQQLLDVIEFLPEGVALLDADDRFVLWNRRYEELVCIKPRVGMTGQSAVRAALACKYYPEAVGKEDEWLDARMKARSKPVDAFELKTSAGTWMRVEERQIGDRGRIILRVDVTELRAREESMRLLFDENPVPLLVVRAEDRVILAANEAARFQYGYPADEFVGRHVSFIVPPEEDVRLSSLPRNAAYGRALDGPRFQQIRADGSRFDVELFAREFDFQGQAARLVAAIDVTEVRRAEADVRKARAFLDAVIEHVPAPIFVKDAADQRYHLINRAGELYLGVPRESVIGKRPSDVFGSASLEIMNEGHAEVLRTGKPLTLPEHLAVTPGFGNRWITTKVVPIVDSGGKAEHVLALLTDLTDQRLAEARAAHLSLHDSLTDLPNRAAFADAIAKAVAEAAASGDQLAVLCADLDRFKEINDVFGHQTGDGLLRVLSKRLQATAGENVFVARLGGDEFAFIVPGPQPSSAVNVADRLMGLVLGDFNVDGYVLNTNLSIGVACFPGDGSDAKTLVANADIALDRAKSEGRGVVRFFEPDMDARLRERRRLLQELRAGMTRGEFNLYYQPQAAMDGRIVGFEALARWDHPTRGMVSPVTFIPIAEESGLIIELGRQILEAACREAASWDESLTVAVNLSPLQFRQGDLPAMIGAILARTGLNPCRLEVEVTESVLVDDVERAVATLRRIKDIGVRTAMDDFGTGYSSLSYLQAFPFDKIKMDRTFIANLRGDVQSSAIVRAILALGRELGLPVLAEGVETAEQAAFLRREGCHEMQGFHIGQPLPIAEYAAIAGNRPRARGGQSARRRAV